MSVKMRTDGNGNILWGEPHIKPIVECKQKNESKQLHDFVALKASRWIKRTFNCPIGAVNFSGGWSDEVCDGYLANYHSTYLVESKVSLIDFRKDAKKKFRISPELGIGKYRFYACPKGLLKLEDLPEKWGLIEVDEKGHCETKIKDINWSAGFGSTDLSSMHCLFSWGVELGLIKSKASHPLDVLQYLSNYFSKHKNKFYVWKSKVGWNGGWAYIYQEPEKKEV